MDALLTHPSALPNRCSATPVRLTAEAPLRFLAAGHAVVPWSFPKYFKDSKGWLKFLNETNVRYYAELRDVRLFRVHEPQNCPTREHLFTASGEIAGNTSLNGPDS